MSEQELVEDLDCLGGLRRESDRPIPIKRSAGFWYVFDPDQDTKLSQGASCFFAHDLDMTTDIHALDRDTGRVCLKFGPSKLRQLGDDPPPARLSLIPNEHVSAEVIAKAIEHTARSWHEDRQLSPALADFLARRPPRLASASQADSQALVAPDEDLRAAALRLVSGLDRSTLCIQGPPGTGKTTLAAAVIVSLLGQGKRVGISSNSHAAILNLMQKCAEQQNGPLACLKVGGPGDAPFFRDCRGARHVTSIRYAVPELDQVGLIGGTAWAFSAASMRDQLDYLFVDEAGQVSTANLIGMSASSRNLVLLGDQMQLGQRYRARIRPPAASRLWTTCSRAGRPFRDPWTVPGHHLASPSAAVSLHLRDHIRRPPAGRATDHAPAGPQTHGRRASHPPRGGSRLRAG